MLSLLPLLVYTCIVLIFCVNGQITPIQNSTGEYWIASVSNSFRNESIVCNTSLSTSNCYVLCDSIEPDICSNANIQCATSDCTINCGKSSCQNIHINTSNSSLTNILCTDENSCKSMRFTMINKAMGSINMLCAGNQSCTNSIIQTNEVEINIDCNGQRSCSLQDIYTGTNSILQYQCYKNASSNCVDSKLIVSGLYNHTQLICNGEATASCNDIQILVPQSYQPGFINIKYVANNGTIIAAMEGSADDMTMKCISSNATIIACNTYTTFPIIGKAQSSDNNNTYIASAAYSYRFQEIECNDAVNGNKCDIRCVGAGSCDYTQIHQNGSNSIGHLHCQECGNMAIKTNGKSLDIFCEDNACNLLSVVTSSTAAINMNCATSTQSSCYNSVINTTNSISLTCSGDESCKYIKLNSGSHTDLNCLDTTSCGVVTIDTNSGASIQCISPFACDTLHVTSKGGEFNALCQYDSSCKGAVFNLSYNIASNTSLDCIGVNSCNQMVLGTYSKNININCSGCEGANITAFSPDTTLSLNCNDTNSCNSINVRMDGSIQLNCTGDASCANSGFYNLTKPTQNMHGISTVKCDGNAACNNLKFIASTDVTITCPGSDVCAVSTIQSLTGRVDAYCGNTGGIDTGSCVQSIITSLNGVNMVCMGDNACNGTNITSNGLLTLDCTGSGNATCAYMNIDSTNNISANTFKCGNASNTNSYSCFNTILNTKANVINFDCYNSGCFSTKINVLNPMSKLTMNCNGDDGCKNAYIQSISKQTQKLDCIGMAVCSELKLITESQDLSINCTGSGSCDTALFQSSNAMSITCGGLRACNKANVVGHGDLSLDCSAGGSRNQCRSMNITMTNNQSTNTFICGNNIVNQSLSSWNACSGLVVNTFAKNIDFQCANTGCNNSDIFANNIDSKLSMNCSGYSACSNFSAITNGYVDINCNGTNSCQYGYIASFKEGVATMANCTGLKACASLKVVTPTELSMDCQGVTSCQLLKIETNTVSLYCDGNEACSKSNISGNGNLSVHCNNIGQDACPQMAINMTFNPNKTSNTFSCSGSCHKTLLKTHADVVSFNCIGISCYDSSLNLYNPTSTLLMNCSASQACNGLNVLTDGELLFNCKGEDSCQSAKINPISKESRVIGSSTINCLDDTACQYLQVTTPTDISLNCDERESCSSSAITSFGDIEMKCNGESACLLSNITGFQDLLLNCTDSGDTNCGHMIINMSNNEQSTNTFLCGTKDKTGNETGSYSCSQSKVDTFAKNIYFDCYDNGCLGNNIIAHNNHSKITMNCNGNGACWHLGLTSNGEISMNCNGESACLLSNITGFQDLLLNCTDSGNINCGYMIINMSNNEHGACWHLGLKSNGAISMICNGNGSCEGGAFINMIENVTTELNCTGSQACLALHVETASNLSMNCTGEKSCNLATSVADSVSLICDGSNACLQSNITGNGNLFIDCSAAGSNACEQMSIDMAFNPNKTSNTLICGNSDSNINKSSNYSCSRTLLRTYADEISFDCKGNYGCYSSNINLLNPTSTLDMSCAATSCNILNIITDGELLLNCKGDTSCQAAKINPVTAEPRVIGSSTINCLNGKACPSLQVITPSDLQINCQQAGSCSSSVIQSFAGIAMNCNGSSSCQDVTVRLLKDDISASLNCMGGTEYSGSCDNLQLPVSNASVVNISCFDKLGCSGINVSATYVDEIRVIATSENPEANSLRESYIDASYAKNVSVSCKGLCSENIINAADSNNVYIKCDTLSFDATEGFMGGCAKWNINANDADMISLKFLGKYSGLNGVVNASNAGMVDITYQSDINYTDNDKNERSLIEGPSDKGSMRLHCVNYGCYFGIFEANDGLMDMNISFEGQCKCSTIEDCVNQWNLTCDAGSNSFNGDKCNDGDTCCDQQSVENIHDSFNKYATLRCPSGGGSSSNGLSGGAIAGIVIGVLLGVVLIVALIYYFRVKKPSLMESEKLINPTENA